ncbi:MAG: ATPase [Clostridiales bacterium]|nr:ATPase [Clostridiales bacterium]
MEIFSILDTIEDVIQKSTTMPLTGKNLVDKEEILELLNEVRANLPNDLKEAKRILDRKDMILKDAQKKADEILSNVDRAVGIYIKEHDITKKAYKQANDIVENAQRNAKEIRTGSREYAEGILIKIQDILKDTINVIDSNREELRN